MTILQGALLGLIQGLGEFLPISSSGHLLLAQLFMGNAGADANYFAAFQVLTILLHIGTLIPVIIVFWHEWWDMILHPIRNHTLILLFIASLPALVMHKLLPMDVFNNGWFMGPSFLLTAVLLLATDAVSRRTHSRSGKKVGLVQAIVMGVLQGIGMLPGVSRSGSTIAGGVFSGLDRKMAARFSFMMSAPAILGSLLLEGYDAYKDGLFQHLPPAPTVVGIIVACATGYAAIRFMLKLINRVPMAWFALYVALLGLAVLAMQLGGSALLPPFHAPEAAASALRALVG